MSEPQISNIFIVTVKDNVVLRSRSRFIKNNNEYYSMIRDLDFSMELSKNDLIKIQLRKLKDNVKWPNIRPFDTLKEYDSISDIILDNDYEYKHNENEKKSIYIENTKLILEIPRDNDIYSCPFIIFK